MAKTDEKIGKIYGTTNFGKFDLGVLLLFKNKKLLRLAIFTEYL